MWPFNKKETRNKTLDQLLAFNAPTSSGMTVNAETAQSITAVHCAVTTISESVASLPIHVYQKANGDKKRLSNYLERLLNHSPNGYMTGYDFKIALMRSVLLRGNAFVHIDFDGAGKAQSLHYLHPDSEIVKKLPTHRIGYQVMQESGKTKTLHQEEVIHLKINSDDGILGQSPISVCRDSIGVSLAQETHLAKVLSNGAMPSGVLESDLVFKDKNAVERVRKQFTERYQGMSKSGEVVMLDQGLKFKPLTMSPADAELLASRSFSVAEVARCFKLSPLLLQDLSHGTYSNFSEANRAYVSGTLRPHLTNVQQALNSRLIPESNQLTTYCEFNTKDLLRASTQERFESYQTGITSGVLSPNECRVYEGLPKYAGGDEYNQSFMNQVEAVKAKNE